VLLLAIRRGSGIPSIPVATILLALASSILFAVFAWRDRPALDTAARVYVDSGLAAIELPRYREYLAQSADPAAVDRLYRLEVAAGPSMTQPANPAQAIAVLHGDHGFERELKADRIVTASEPAYAAWKHNRQQFDQLTASTLDERMGLTAQAWHEPWRLVTALLLHPAASLWLTNLAFLLLVGPFAEAAAGSVRFLACYLGGGALAASLNLLFFGATLVGDWGALAALAAMLAVAFGTQPMAARLLGARRQVRVPALAAPLLVVAVEALRWTLAGRAAVDVPSDVAGLAFGAALAGVFKLRDSRRVRDLVAQPHAADADGPKESELARQAREAATRLETRRATQLFKELVDLEPRQVEHLCGYLNVALMGPDETVLQDAALRLLWLRTKSHSDQLRKAFLLLTQPKVLKVLPIDEHLRLARRLVRLREDATALKVLDAILTDNHLRQLYGRQLADCLLGIYTGYVRRRLTTLAETIHSRLTTYFEAPDRLGGVPPATRPPTTLFTAAPRSPNTRLPPRS
jgi:membrane associated rhomboid family serine protease